MQILTPFPGLGTTTMPAHQSVGSSIFEMTPRVSILSSSSFTFGSRGIGTLLGVLTEYGLALSSSSIL